MQKPHIRRDSFWSYLSLAVPMVVNFGDDPLKSPTLVELEWLPNLLFFAIHDMNDRSLNEGEFRQPPDAVKMEGSISVIRRKIDKSVESGELNVYCPDTFLRIDPRSEDMVKIGSLVRLDDFSNWFLAQGIEISPFPLIRSSDADSAYSLNDGGSLSAIEIDPSDLPDELSAANIAFRAVSNGYGDENSTFKNRLIGYLQKNFPGIGSEAISRVATVANPDKTRGRKNHSKRGVTKKV